MCKSHSNCNLLLNVYCAIIDNNISKYKCILSFNLVILKASEEEPVMVLLNYCRADAFVHNVNVLYKIHYKSICYNI